MFDIPNARKNTNRDEAPPYDELYWYHPRYGARSEDGMRSPGAVKHRNQSPAEEFTNSVSHGLGLIAALVGTPYLIIHSIQYESMGFLVGISVFCLTIILRHSSSSLYHALPHGRAKHVQRITEHSAIFLLIAGTYTPFTLGALRGPWGGHYWA